MSRTAATLRSGWIPALPIRRAVCFGLLMLLLTGCSEDNQQSCRIGMAADLPLLANTTIPAVTQQSVI